MLSSSMLQSVALGFRRCKTTPTLLEKFNKRILCHFSALLLLVSLVGNLTLSLAYPKYGVSSHDAPRSESPLRHTDVPSPPPRVAIVQYFGGSSHKAAGFRSARHVFAKYAEMHGYAYYALEENDVALNSDVLNELQISRPTKQHNWRRPFFLSQIINEGKHEWLAYFDTDIVITNPTHRLEEWIGTLGSEDKNLIIANAPDGINNGVFFQRATNWSLSFNTAWWEQRSRNSMLIGDNWPFMATLLIFWSSSEGHTYANQCSMAVNAQMESWPSFFECYMKVLEVLRKGTPATSDCGSKPSSCGSALPNKHIAAVWDLNKGLGFQGKNAWTSGSFLIHFAGKEAAERDRLLLEYSTRTISKYFQILEERDEATPGRSHHDELEMNGSPETLNENTSIPISPITYPASGGQVLTVWPLSFSAPEEIWIPVVPVKKNDFAPIIPGNRTTYTYHDEISYYEGYRHALFGITRKKAGWDCMRHLEIMANGAIPYFVDIEKLPSRTMQHYPKDLIRAAKILPGLSFGGDVSDPASFNLDRASFNFSAYHELASQILEHSRKFLTTRAMAGYIIRTVGFSDTSTLNRVLIATHCVDDYAQDATLHGLKKIFGKRLIDYVPESRLIDTRASEPPCVTYKRNASIPEYRLTMYMDSRAAESENFDTRQGYGNGFTLWNKLPYSTYGDVDRTKIYEQLEANAFDLVFISDRLLRTAAQRKFVEKVRKHVPKQKVVLLWGTDIPVPKSEFAEYADMSEWMFSREIYD